VVETTNDNQKQQELDSINSYYGGLIKNNQDQIQRIYDNNNDGLLFSREKSSLLKFEENIKKLDSTRTVAKNDIEIKYASKPNRQLEKIAQNDIAFIFMVFFLELIILIGVGFFSYYTWGSYDNMSRLLKTTKFQDLEEYLKLISILYENGKNQKDDPLPDFAKLHAICELQGIDIDNADLEKFINICSNFNILFKKMQGYVFAMNMEDAKRTFESQFHI
jgi:hypothetical protein